MRHARIQAHVDDGTLALEHIGRFLDSFSGDMRIAVAASEEDRSSVERSLVIPRRTGGTNHSAAETKDCGIFARMARGVLCCKTCALRKSAQNNLVRWKSEPIRLVNQAFDHAQCGTQSRLIRRKRRQKAERIPGASCRLRSRPSNIGHVELFA